VVLQSIWAGRPADIYGRRKRDRLYTALWGVGVVLGGFASATLRHFLIARELTRMDWVRFAWKPALTSAGAGSVCYVLLDGVRPAWVLLFYIALILASLRMFSKFSFSVIKDVMSSPPGPE